MYCEVCRRRPASMRMTIRKPDGEQHMLMLCGMCAYRFQNVMPQSATAAHAAQGSQLTPEVFSHQQFPTQRHGMFAGFSQKTQEALKNAERISREYNLPAVGTFPLLMGLMELPGHPATVIMGTYGVTTNELKSTAKKEQAGRDQIAQPKQMQLSQNTLSVLEMAQNKAVGLSDTFIEPQHIMLAMLEMNNMSATRWLKERGVDIPSLERDLMNSLASERPSSQIVQASPEELLLGAATPRAQQQEARPAESALAKYARDLTQLAREGKLMPVVGREAELVRVERILSRLQKNNPLLLGEAGVGKTAVVEALAQQILRGEVPRRLKDNRVLEVDLTAMIAGTDMRGEFEERMKSLIDEVKAAGPGTILFIDEIHTLVGTGAGEGSMDAGNMLKPALARGEMRLIGATTLQEYKKYIEKDPALSRRFQPVLVGEPTVEQTIAIIEGIKERFEEHQGVTLSSEAISAAVTLSSHYITDRFLPDKAIDLIDEACSMVAIENEEKGQQRSVIADDVAAVISSWTGIPLTKLIDSEKQRLLDMEKIIHRRIVDQEEAVCLVADVVRRSRAGLKDPSKPNGAFIFAGPTGVGKTELARALADFLFNDDNAVIRLDMSEYMEPESVSRMIGAPPGYVGYEQGGQLTEKVKFRPYSVVLFDEMEKAHPQVLNLLLQIADAGRLTDGQGKEVNFKNTIVILTTNAGAQLFFDPGLEGNREALREAVTETIIQKTSPELVNRMDAIALFNPLTFEQVADIIGLQVGYLASRLKAKEIGLEVTGDALAHLAKKGFDPEFGARPARRAVQDELESPLSEMILGGQLNPGETAVVEVQAGSLAFRAVKE